MSRKLFVASDHAAYEAKCEVISFLEREGYEIVDLGTDSTESTDYPCYAKELALQVQQEGGRGVLLCGSGIGVSIVANRFAKVRAALCRSIDDAYVSRLHNDANVLCLGGRVTPAPLMKEIIQKFLETEFEGGRHQRRIDQFNDLGKEGK